MFFCLLDIDMILYVFFNLSQNFSGVDDVIQPLIQKEKPEKQQKKEKKAYILFISTTDRFILPCRFPISVNTVHWKRQGSYETGGILLKL